MIQTIETTYKVTESAYFIHHDSPCQGATQSELIYSKPIDKTFDDLKTAERMVKKLGKRAVAGKNSNLSTSYSWYGDGREARTTYGTSVKYTYQGPVIDLIFTISATSKVLATV